MRTTLLAASALLLAAALPMPLPAHAQPLPTEPAAALRGADVATLKTWYLACDRASRQAPLDRTVAQACSLTAEALKQQAFGGDFDRLIAWWRTARDEPVAAAAR